MLHALCCHQLGPLSGSVSGFLHLLWAHLSSVNSWALVYLAESWGYSVLCWAQSIVSSPRTIQGRNAQEGYSSNTGHSHRNDTSRSPPSMLFFFTWGHYSQRWRHLPTFPPDFKLQTMNSDSWEAGCKRGFFGLYD